MGNGGTHEFVWSSSFPDLESNKWIYSLKYWLKFHKLVSSVLLMTCTVEPSHQNNNLLQTLSSVCILSQIFFEYNDPTFQNSLQLQTLRTQEWCCCCFPVAIHVRLLFTWKIGNCTHPITPSPSVVVLVPYFSHYSSHTSTTDRSIQPNVTWFKMSDIWQAKQGPGHHFQFQQGGGVFS